jgi:trigger factor
LETTINTLGGWERELDVTITVEELQPHFDKAYLKYRPRAEIRGFRKGKAPITMIKRLFGEQIEHDSLTDITNDLFQQIIKEKEIHPIGEQVLTDIQYERGQHLKFKIKYEIKPEFELKTYQGIHVEKPIHIVTDEEVEQELERRRRANHSTKSVEKVTDDEHIVTVDMQMLDNTGFPMIGKKNEDLRLYLGSVELPSELRVHLLHASVGDDKRIDLVSHDGQGKEAAERYSVKVKKIEQIEYPELSDAFAKQITKGKVETLEELRRTIRAEMEQFWTERGNQRVLDGVADELVKQNDFAAPETLVKGFLDSYTEDYRNQQPNKKLPPDFDEKEFRQQNRAYAIWQAKWLLIREKIIELEHIVVTDQDLEAMAEAESQRLKINRDRLTNYYKTSENMRDKILNQKVLRFLRDNAVITEKYESIESSRLV